MRSGLRRLYESNLWLELPANIRLALCEHTRPTSPRAGQTRVGDATPAAAPTLTTWPCWLGDRDTTFPIADQTRDDIIWGDSTRPGSHAPRAGFLRLNSLRLTHLSLSFERSEEINYSGNQRSPSSMDLAIIILCQVNLKVRLVAGTYMPPPISPDLSSPWISEMRASVVSIKPAIEAAFCSAQRVTFAGSMMPAATRSSNLSVAAL